jgi:hypothetical protein
MKKFRKDKGWRTPTTTIKAKRKDIINNCLEPAKYWDDWVEPRDGLRGSKDRTKIQYEHSYVGSYYDAKKWNKKNKRMLKIRKARKLKRKETNATK